MLSFHILCFTPSMSCGDKTKTQHPCITVIILLYLFSYFFSGVLFVYLVCRNNIPLSFLLMGFISISLFSFLGRSSTYYFEPNRSIIVSYNYNLQFTIRNLLLSSLWERYDRQLFFYHRMSIRHQIHRSIHC